MSKVQQACTAHTLYFQACIYRHLPMTELNRIQASQHSLLLGVSDPTCEDVHFVAPSLDTVSSIPSDW